MKKITTANIYDLWSWTLCSSKKRGVAIIRGGAIFGGNTVLYLVLFYTHTLTPSHNVVASTLLQVSAASDGMLVWLHWPISMVFLGELELTVAYGIILKIFNKIQFHTCILFNQVWLHMLTFLNSVLFVSNYKRFWKAQLHNL